MLSRVTCLIEVAAAVLCIISTKRSDITMHQNRKCLMPLRIYGAVHDAAFQIHEEMISRMFRSIMLVFEHAWTLPLRNTWMSLLTLNSQPG